MSTRQGGKKKPLKAPKKKEKEISEEDAEFKKKQKDAQDAVKLAREKALTSGPMGGSGIKKSGKK